MIRPALPSARHRHQSGTDAILLAAGVAGAVGIRTAIAGPRGPASTVAAEAFALILLALAATAGWRPARPRPAWLIAGAAAGAALVAIAQVRAGSLPLSFARIPLATLAVWGPAVALVGIAEEVALRGALFDAVGRWLGPAGALGVTSAIFALIHVPLYGASAIPLDLAVGVWLGGLRVATGSVAAPAAAHVLADLASGWLR